jgi:hypothetical protein
MSLDSLSSLVRIPAGRYRIGSDRFYPEEAPSREIDLPAFQIERSPVTNREFAHFVRSSGYRTISELPADPQVYPLLTPEQRQPASIVFQAPPSAVDRLFLEPVGNILRGPAVPLLIWTITLSFTSPTPMPSLTAPGPIGVCPPQRNGR